jgi:hypothetical protein
MATFSKITLSGSTDGKPILVNDAASPGLTIHTSSSTATTFDEVWLYATNTSTTARLLTIEYGGTTAGFQIEQTIPGQSGLVLIVPGLLMKGNSTPWTIAAFADNTTDINITGYVNRITA